MNMRKVEDNDGSSRNPIAKVKLDIVETIFSIKSGGNVTPQTLQPLFNLLRMIENVINKEKSTFDWKSCSLTEKIGNDNVDIANKIAFLLNHIHLEASISSGCSQAQNLNAYACEKINIEHVRSREKKNLFMISLKYLFNIRADYIRTLGLETQEIIRILNQQYLNKSEKLSQFIRNNCRTCQEEKDTGIKSNKTCFCHFYGNKVSYSRISGTLYVEVKKIIQLLATEDIDHFLSDDCIEQCDIHKTCGNSDMRKKRVIIQFDNRAQISSEWCLPDDLKFSKKIDIFKCQLMIIEVWEQINNTVRMVATTVMPLESIAKRLPKDQNDENNNVYNVFLEPIGLMNVVVCFTAEANKTVVDHNRVLSVGRIQGSDGDNALISDDVEIKKSNDSHPLKRGKIFWAKMKRCRLARPDEADITVALWVQWYKYSIDKLIVPMSSDQNMVTCSRDYSKCRKENTKWNFLRSMVVKVLGANSKSINITSRPEVGLARPFDRHSSTYLSINQPTSFQTPFSRHSQRQLDLPSPVPKFRVDPSSISYDHNRSRTVYQFFSTQTHAINESINYPAKLHTPLSVTSDNIQGDFQAKSLQLEHKSTPYQFITPIKSTKTPSLNITPPTQTIPNIQQTPLTNFIPNNHYLVASTPYNKENQHTVSTNLTVEELDRDYDNYFGDDEDNADNHHVTMKHRKYEGQSIYFIKDVNVQDDYDENQRENQPPSSIKSFITPDSNHRVTLKPKDVNHMSSNDECILVDNENKKSNTSRITNFNASRFSTSSPCKISNTNIDQFYCPDVTRENSYFMIVGQKIDEADETEHKDNPQEQITSDAAYESIYNESSGVMGQSSNQGDILQYNEPDDNELDNNEPDDNELDNNEPDDNEPVIEPIIEPRFIERDDVNPNVSKNSDQHIEGFYSSIDSQSPNHSQEGIIDDMDVVPTHVVNVTSGVDMFESLELLSVLGMGNFGKVLLCQHKTSPNKVFSIKVINKQKISCDMELEALYSELNILRKISMQKHPFLVEFLGSFQNQTNLFFALEFASGGDLMGHVHSKHFTEDVARFYGACVVLAFEFLHRSRIMYRDLKLDNVLMDYRGYAKITDFGLSKENMDYESITTTFCGTLEFLAPEIICEARYNRGVDWWAFGVLMFEMIRGESPFVGKDDDELMEAIIINQVDYSHLSLSANALINRLLRSNPKNRLGNEHENGVNNVKKHAFFKGIDWDGMLNGKVKAPMIPKLEWPGDTKYFEKDFTDLPISLQHEDDVPVPTNKNKSSINFPNSSNEPGYDNAYDSFDYDAGRTPNSESIDQSMYAAFDVPFNWERLEHFYRQETDVIDANKRKMSEINNKFGDRDDGADK